jgi:RNA methyltransferase, TrmH family
MFPVAKLKELSLKTALKKTALILKSIEIELVRGRMLHEEPQTRHYLNSLLAVLKERPLPDAVAGPAAALEQTASYASAETFLRAVNGFRHALLGHLGAEAAEWDLLDTRTGALDSGRRRVYPISVYLEEIRSPFNVGSIFRTAEAFGVNRLWLSPAVPSPVHPRSRRTSRGAEAVLAWSIAGLNEAAAAGPVFALETGGRPLKDFSFPKQGTVLLGSEELGLSPEALAIADNSLGRVSIPMAGAKRSLNVAVAFGILMQWWFSVLDDSVP